MARESICDYIARLPAEAPDGLRRVDNSHVAGRFLERDVSSVFQPVVGADGAVIGHAGLVRCRDAEGVAVSPRELFARARSDSDLVRLDRLCRTLHTINYFASARPGCQLFLKLDPRLLSSVADQHGHAFERVLTSLGVAPDDIVIEIPLTANQNPVLVAHVVANYSFRGFRVALHYAGDAGWRAMLAHLRADIVQAPSGDTVPAAVSGAHECGARALITHVETPDGVEAARASGADLLLGYAFGTPGP